MLWSICKVGRVELSVSCILAVAERVLKTCVIIQTVDAMILSNEASMYEALKGTTLLSIRYLLAANRHVYAYTAGSLARNRLTQYYHAKWLLPTRRRESIEEGHILHTISTKVRELVSRISVDLIPGVVSILAGCYTLYTVIEENVGLWCILYIGGIEGIIYIAQYDRRAREERCIQQEAMASAQVYAISSDTLANRETVHVYNRIAHEVGRFIRAGHSLIKREVKLLKISNYSSCIIHWMVHLVQGGVIFLTRGHLTDNAHILLVLYHVGEIRAGIQELQTFYRYYTSTKSLLDGLDTSPTVTSYRTVRDTGGREVQFQNVSLTLGQRQLFKGLNLEFSAGTLTMIRGENGVGKTTLFRVLLRQLYVDSGEVTAPPKDKVVMCEQLPQLFNGESVAYNVAYGCQEVLGREDKDLETFVEYGSAVMEAVEMLEIRALEGSRVATLSGGERQRISLARVLARAIQSPRSVELLLLDEWDSALDTRGRELAYQVIKYIRQLTKCTTLCITHQEGYAPQNVREVHISRLA